MSEYLCPKCNAPNRTTARFCAVCGAPLLTGVEKPVSGPGSSRRSSPRIVHSALSAEMILEGRYRIEEELGHGGFGAVYRAWDNRLSKAVAVKENLDISPEAQRQFAREATVLANLSHPNLPRVIDHFAIPDQGQYLVMDYVEGEDLLTLLERQGEISTERVLEWMIQVADALEYLHSQEPPVVHRDIKPSNIRITPRGKAMLVDFGLVKFSDPRKKTTSGARAITPGYAPPEQYGIGKTDIRTDIYALGATMYRLVTGLEPPESVQRLAGEHLLTAIQVNPSISSQLSNVIDRAMALEPGKRYQDSVELKGALRDNLVAQGNQFSSQEPVQAEELRTIVVDRVSESLVKPAVAAPVVPAVVLPDMNGRARPRRLGLWIGIGVAFFMIVVCSVVMAALFIGEGSLSTPVAQMKASATSLVSTSIETQASSTTEVAERTDQATSTAEAALSATSRVRKTVEVLPNPFHWPVKFYDGFDMNQFGWDEATSDSDWNALLMEIKNGLYHVKLEARNYEGWIDVANIPTGENFSLSVRTRQVAGKPDALRGLIFRAQDGNNLYLFGIRDDHSFGFWVQRDELWTKLFYQDWTNFIEPSHWNEITVVAEGKKFQLYINGHLVGSTTNDWFTNGQAGLYFEISVDRTAEFEVDDLLLATP